jgi:hypothetical protein
MRGLSSSTVAAGAVSSSAEGVCLTIGAGFSFVVAAEISRLGFDPGFSVLPVGVSLKGPQEFQEPHLGLELTVIR